MTDAFTPPPPEPARVASGRAFLIAMITLCVFAAVSFAGFLLSRVHGPSAPMPGTLGRREVGIVRQVPFAYGEEAARLREGQLRRLSGYGWVDRDAGIIHQPVDRAMDQLLGMQRELPP